MARGVGTLPQRALAFAGVFLLTALIASACSTEKETLDSRVQRLARLAFLAGDEGPALLVDRFEVTRGDYAQFLRETGYRGEGQGFLFDWGRAGATPGVPLELESHPVVFVSREDAIAYASWLGMRLPSIEEWERLACGRADPRSDPDIVSASSRVLYPWGSAWQPLYANTIELGLGKTAPVGTFESGRSEIGCYDVAGNVWEWMAPQGDGTRAIVKGGAFDYSREKAQCYESMEFAPQQRISDVGFRCVAEFEPAMRKILGGFRPGVRDRAALVNLARHWGGESAPVLEALAGSEDLDAGLLRAMAAAAREQ